MMSDLGFTYAALAMFMLTFAVAVEGIPYADVNVNETAQPGSSGPGHWDRRLELSTVWNCTPGLPCSTFVRTQVQVPAKVKKVNIECFDLAESTFKQKSWKCSAKKRLRQLCNITYDCIETRPGQKVLVTVTTYYKNSTKRPFQRWYEVEGLEGFKRMRRFSVSVDGPSRFINVSILPGPSIKTRLCYKQPSECTELEPPVFHLIDTSYSLTANLSFPYLLPCLCVEVYPTETDAVRTKHCPFENKPLAGGRDVWISSSHEMYDQTLVWKPVCRSASLMPSASLCWQVQENPLLCLPVPNSSLQVEDWRYNVSTVDQHPKMCVQFSLNGTYDVRCPFRLGHLEWQAVILPAAWHFRVRLTSSIPASFSAQLCILEGERCVAIGAVHSVKTENTTETELRLPFTTLSTGLCVQVWRSAPFLIGRRLICPQSSHGRLGLIAMASVVLVVFMMTLACLTYCGVRRGLSDWQLGQKPVLLVCSSEQMPQVSAVCALASLLQGELCAGVRMALWAQNTGGVTKLGPLPWLYGQCEAVRGAGGRVLIAWSPEAREAYWHWKKDGAREQSEAEKKHRKESQKDMRNNDLVEEETAKVLGGKKSGHAKSDGQREPSPTTVPILRAALACLECELQRGRQGHGFALVYFEGLSHSHDIPLELRGVPRYCLPQDFGGLVRELHGGTVGGEKEKGCACWTGLLSKILALRLAQRLRMWLPQMRPLEEEVMGITVTLPWEPEREERSFRLARLPLSWLFRERTAQTAWWEKQSLTMSTQKGRT
ncbi:interleukin-17 receptor C [Anguilla anguilla]|uniref:interleukin-17 receptor C n=1 Tax=Anguilla anguilla TaxID=7936 RepID=UPI0015AED735|nr:interleukin-17 receptor C [Anguilla anguilla]XP_035238987.1 interleukin-17 receptor C [Anguilla anguilla]